MPYSLNDLLVVGVASSALFDLSDSDAVFKDKGEDAYRAYQEERLDETLSRGVAFPFIKRLLSLNELAREGERLVEVVVLSRNDPDTGLRVMRSIAEHELDITRAIFIQGRAPYAYMGALNMSLFLSAEESDVRAALAAGYAAGQVMGTPASDGAGKDLRIAFDFDGVLGDDSSEQVMQASGLDAFHENEVANVDVPVPAGRLLPFLQGINRIQDIEERIHDTDPTYNRRVHVAIVTARNAPSHERVIKTLKSWDVRVNDAFFLGGVEKAGVIRVLRPHIFFDDQRSHLTAAANEVPSVHVPFGVVNAVPTNMSIAEEQPAKTVATPEDGTDSIPCSA